MTGTLLNTPHLVSELGQCSAQALVPEIYSVGVIAIGRNEGERLRKCLSSIPAGVPFVYVDSGSTDGSVASARDLGALVVELDISIPFTAARARNEGAAALLKTRPDLAFLQFIDGDCDLEPNWLDAAREFLARHGAVAACCGRRRERFPHASLYNLLADQEWNTPVGPAEACGGDAMYRTEAFLAVEGFDPHVVAGEEPELCSRLRRQGWSIWRIDAPMTVHDLDMHRFGQWWIRAIRSGFGYAQVWSCASDGEARIYGRELGRALFWTGGVISFALLAALAMGPSGLLAAPLLWTGQWLRLAQSKGVKAAGLLMIGKLAEVIGVWRFVRTRALSRSSGAIFYK